MGGACNWDLEQDNLLTYFLGAENSAPIFLPKTAYLLDLSTFI